MSYNDIEPNRLSHLELIQAVIGRLAGNSFLIKGWAITVAGAFFGFALNSRSWRLAAAATVPILAFWALDTYFLRAERLFRALYDEVRSKDERVRPFAMGATGPNFVGRVRDGDTACDNKAAASYWDAAFSMTLGVLYVGLLIATAVIAAGAYREGQPETHTRCQPPVHAARMRSAIPSRSNSSSYRGPRGQMAPNPSRCHRGTR